ncbi:hypothetical protein DERF_009285 [Dermatophagoides farinae]|uniref:Uncharacterized protein n=1 Tax=Dermatophagoides farinae TaxID=6954 RepID=A0A922HWL7_DERFA|nr:hypothetical protein DERF_009285 [Dermatophagoides farinae]
MLKKICYCLLEGAKGFYKGIVPNLLRVTPACAITFVVYENTSHLLLYGWSSTDNNNNSDNNNKTGH